jgi:putative membrane protein
MLDSHPSLSYNTVSRNPVMHTSQLESAMFTLGIYWLLSALSVTAISRSLPGFRINHFGTALIVAGVYGVLHVLLSKILKIILFLPMWLTFGLFALVINAFLLYITDKLLDSFNIDSWLTTFIAAALLTILNGIWAKWLL